MNVRVLTITSSFPPGYTGGAEVAMLMTCKGLARRGVDIHILTINTRMPQEINRYYELEGLLVHQVAYRTPRRRPLTDVFDGRVYWQTLREIRCIRPDLVHIHNISGASLAPFVAGRVTGTPVVATLHDSWLLCPNNMLHRTTGALCDPSESRGRCAECYRRYDFWGDVPWRRSVFTALVRNVHTFISPSQALVELHVRAGYDQRRFRVIRNGITARMPVTLTHPGLQHIVSTQGEYNTLVFAGGGVEIKGVVTLLEALPLLVRHIERLRVSVAGWGDAAYLERLRHYAPTVSVLGQVPYAEVPALFAAGDLTLALSIWHENSPVVIQQSLLVGTPVVGSALGGIPELVREGETGYLFPHGDPVALAEKIILHLARAPFERRQMRRRCAAFAAEHLNYEQHLDAVEQVYRQALGRA